MNVVCMMGRLAFDPRINGEGDRTVANIRIAVDRRFKRDGQPEADFFDCVAFGRRAEFVSKYFKKGTKVSITGSLQNRSYTRQNGDHVETSTIVVDQIEFAESKRSQEPNPQPESKPRPVAKADNDDVFVELPSAELEELPFE